MLHAVAKKNVPLIHDKKYLILSRFNSLFLRIETKLHLTVTFNITSMLRNQELWPFQGVLGSGQESILTRLFCAKDL